MALLPIWLLVCAVSLFAILPITNADELYVRPFEAENCGSRVPCLTFNEYASDADRYFVDNTTFTFMSGSHHLNTSLRQEELSNITLRVMDEAATIRVNFSSSPSIPNVAWINCYNITVSGLNFDIIGLTSEDGEFTVLEFDDTSPIFLSDLTLHGSGRWRAILLRNVNQASISSLFIFGAMSSSGSALHATESFIDFYGFNNFTGNVAKQGGAIALYSCSSNLFEDFAFSGNSAEYGGAMYLNSGSLNVSGNLNFHANTALNGGAMIVFNSFSDFSLSGRIVFISNIAATFGGALSFSAPSNHAIISGMVSFINNTASNGGGAIFIHAAENLSISGNVSFLSNTAISVESESGFGGAVDVFIGSVSFSGEVVFMNNSASSGGAITLRNAKCSLSDSILFEGNTAIEAGGAISLQHPDVRLISFKQSELSMTGTITFLTNLAKQGGAIAFEEDTKLMLKKNLETNFIRNYADIYGGAIFVGSDTTSRNLCFEPRSPSSRDDECFFELDSSFHINLNFSYNLAGEAGAAIFGGNLEGCKVNISGSPKDPLFILQESAISEIIPDSGDNMTSNISSEPLRVYICNDTSQFMDSHEIEIVRGREITLSVKIVGQGNGTIPSLVRISLSNDVSIDAALRIQRTKKECTRVYYRLKSKNNATTFTLFPDEGPCRGIGISSASVSVTFLPCPDGFKLEGSECTCEERLQVPEYGVTCHVDNSTIFRRSNTFWMGTVYENDTYRGLILHSGCPIDYCTSSPMYITLDNLDAQCDHNHMGILCGSCQDNHSIAFGGLHCLQCSNSYLALILPFTLAGLVLVATILLLKLCANANGTINGLIFYANVVQANRSVFVPLGDTSILTVFIAWLNLDLGIETCFYDGMNTYVFTWLQFLFPFYVWILIIIIIVMCHYSTRVSKVFGTNPVTALATLLLLSYSKILRTVIFALSFTRLEYPDGIQLVWRFDGTVPYFQRADHIILGVFSILVLMFLFVPYTLLLLCGHWLRKCSHWKFFSWINTIMPFLEAYYGPFKKETRYWTGLLLLVRCILFLTFSLTSDGGNQDSKANLLAVSSITVCLATLAWLHRGLYEKLYNDILEGSFILNLCIFAVATYHVDEYKTLQAAVAYTSIAVAFVTFLGIVLCHAYLILRNTSIWKKFVKKIKLFHNPNACDGSNQQPCEQENCDSNVRGPTTTFLELRESLLNVSHAAGNQS